MRKGELVLIFLPNKFERFSAGLRNRIQRLSSVDGPTAKQRCILRKLHLAKSLINNEEETPINISEYCAEILRAVQIIKIENERQFSFGINSKEVFLIKKHIFDSLLLTLCKENFYVKIVSSQKGIGIFYSSLQSGNISRLAEKLNATVLKEIKSGKAVVFIKACFTDKKGILPLREIDYLKDPYSVVNLYING